VRLALGVEYDGSAFAGFQLQRGVRTVQAGLEEALTTIADAPVRVHCAGRTDAGVHALGQVVHFDTEALRPDHAWVRGTNTCLPPEIRVLWALPVAPDFHARYTALARTYRYVLLNREVRPAVCARKVGWFYRPLDLARMQSAACHLSGEHDFSAFRAQACQSRSPIRRVMRLEVSRADGFYVLEIQANAFLMHMVRNIVGVLMEIGCGKREPDWAREVLASRNRCLAGITAPADGLYLWEVEYPAHFGIPRMTEVKALPGFFATAATIRGG
jgi:tRNA pseudouridine38-40 synthase